MKAYRRTSTIYFKAQNLDFLHGCRWTRFLIHEDDGICHIWMKTMTWRFRFIIVVERDLWCRVWWYMSNLDEDWRTCTTVPKYEKKIDVVTKGEKKIDFASLMSLNVIFYAEYMVHDKLGWRLWRACTMLPKDTKIDYAFMDIVTRAPWYLMYDLNTDLWPVGCAGSTSVYMVFD